MVAHYLFLTGRPGCGKSTVIQRVVDLLRITQNTYTQREIRMTGFVTREMRDSSKTNRRVGFEAIGVATGERTVLAHVDSKSRLRVGPYGVELEDFEEMFAVECNVNTDIRIVDEVGKMECASTKFLDLMDELLQDQRVPILGTVAKEGDGLIAKLKKGHYKRVGIIELTNELRDDLPNGLVERIHATVPRKKQEQISPFPNQPEYH